jgi:hypothetical protein
MNISYLIYEAERPKTVAEQRSADVQAGKLAASFARLGSSVKEAVMRASGRDARLGADAAARDGGMSVADLERLYSAPCGPQARDGHGADGERTVRSG